MILALTHIKTSLHGKGTLTHLIIYEEQYLTHTVHFVCQYDGVTNYLHTPFLIDLINSGSLVLPDLEVPVPERFVKPQERQHLYVPGSPEAYVGVVGKSDRKASRVILYRDTQ